MLNDPLDLCQITPLQSNLGRLLAQSDSFFKPKSIRFRLKNRKKPVNGLDVLKSKSFKDYTYSEEQLQIALARYLDELEENTKAFKWFHIPNGGRRGWKTAKSLKEQGVKRGVPDICIVLPDQKVIWIELKAQGGALGLDQKAFCNDVLALDHKYYPVKGAHPIDVIQKTVAILRDNGVVA